MPPPEGTGIIGGRGRANAATRRASLQPGAGISGKPVRLPTLASHRLAGKTKKSGPETAKNRRGINGTATIYVFVNMVRFDKVHYHTLLCAKIRAIRAVEKA